MNVLYRIVAAILLLLPSVAWAQTQQCVSTAIAGGTADALTIPQLPCTATSTLLVLTLTATNVTTSPTLQQIGVSAPQVILSGQSGGAMTTGQLQAGGRVLLTYNGANWFLVSSVASISASAPQVVNSIALLRSNAIPLTSVIVAGWYGAGTTWGGTFSYVPSDVTSSDNSCTIIVDALGHRYYRQFVGDISLAMCGAKSDGTTDDSTADIAAVAAASALNVGVGGVVYVPPGISCVKQTGLNLGTNVSLEGAWTRGSELSTCGVDVPLVTAAGDQTFIARLSLLGFNSPTATSNVLTINSPSELMLLDDIYVAFGAVPISSNAGDLQLRNVQANAAYGTAFLFVNGGNIWVERSTFDQNAPYNNGVLPSCAPGCSISAWAQSTTYTAGQGGLRVSSQGFRLQLMTNTGCTTLGSGTGPTLQPYGTNITDGTCVWQLAGATALSAIQLNAGQSEAKIQGVDATCGICDIGINVQAGNSTVIQWSTVGTEASNGILIQGSMSYATVSNLEINGCLLTSCSAIEVDTSGTGTQISNSAIVTGSYYGLNLLTGGVNVNNLVATTASQPTVQTASGAGQININNSNLTSGGSVTVNVVSGAGARSNIDYNTLTCSGNTGNACVDNAGSATVTGNL